MPSRGLLWKEEQTRLLQSGEELLCCAWWEEMGDEKQARVAGDCKHPGG